MVFMVCFPLVFSEKTHSISTGDVKKATKDTFLSSCSRIIASAEKLVKPSLPAAAVPA